jgi:hypothetical protein
MGECEGGVAALTFPRPQTIEMTLLKLQNRYIFVPFCRSNGGNMEASQDASTLGGGT